MKNYRILLVLCTLALSCSSDDQQSPEPQIHIENYTDMLDDILVTAPFQSAVILNDNMLIATDKGVLKNNLETKEWEFSGLENEEILSLFVHPTTDKIFAGVKSDYSATKRTLFVSEDGGNSWREVPGPIFDTLDNRYENYVSFAVHLDKPELIYANLEGGTMIAISKDGGENWDRMNYGHESYFGYGSYIAFLANDPNTLYQGSENPLDDAWFGFYEINEDDPVLLENFEKIMTLDEWGNRRPNEIKNYDFATDTFYIGQEGALSKVTPGGASKYIYKAEEEGNFPYSYITALWVDSEDTNHILFGGDLNHEVQPMSLYVTFDEGENIQRFEDKMGFENPRVREIVEYNGVPLIIVNDIEARKIKLLNYNN